MFLYNHERRDAEIHLQGFVEGENRQVVRVPSKIVVDQLD